MDNSKPAPRHGAIEEAYLRIVKATVVVLMTLALLAVIGLIPFAAYHFLQTPKAPAPAQAAPAKAIDPAEVTKFLLEEERKRQEQERRAKEMGAAAANSVPASQTSSVLKYMNEANNLMACADEFRKLAEMTVVPLTPPQMLEQLNELRLLTERLAADPTRGDEWVAAMSSFVCGLLKDPAVGQLKKEGKVGGVFYPSIRFHAAAWSRIANDKRRFEQHEAGRVAAETAEEEARVSASKLRAIAAISAAGAAFIAFMLMALYLIFARVERNLAGIEIGVAAAPVSDAAS